MDERLKKALDFSNFMVTLENQRRMLKDKFKESCVFYHNGGTFFISTDLVVFVKTLVDLNRTSSVIIDDNLTPVEITDLNTFLTQILDRYSDAVKSYYNDYNSLTKTRSIENIVK